MKDSYIDYSMSVIIGRALPDVRDGLKPVQRRILWSLHQNDDGRFIKVANIVGDTMKYHPHGDASIGDALVVLANKRYLIEGQGNFGNILTGDPAQRLDLPIVNPGQQQQREHRAQQVTAGAADDGEVDHLCGEDERRRNLPRRRDCVRFGGFRAAGDRPGVRTGKQRGSPAPWKNTSGMQTETRRHLRPDTPG